MDLKKYIRSIPDYPKKGILFRDITTLIKDKDAFKNCIDQMSEKLSKLNYDKIAAIESRGFILGGALASNLNAGFVPVRKSGKLPADVFEVKYNLEYGSNSLAIHRDAVEMGERVLVVDDLLATGGTAAATVHLLRQLGGEIVGCAFLVELLALRGREKLDGCTVHSLLSYS